jgi:DNA-binding NarL/FixJ family response regulator
MTAVTDNLDGIVNGAAAGARASLAVLSTEGELHVPLVRLVSRSPFALRLSGAADTAGASEAAGPRVDVLLLACETLDGDAVDRARTLAERLGGAHPVLVPVHCPRSHVVRRALRSGIDGVVVAADAQRALVATVAAVLAGQVVLPTVTRDRLETPALSHRERQILSMAIGGSTNAEISRALFLATSTVKSHLSSAFVKLDVSSRKEAAAMIHDLTASGEPGLLTSDDVFGEVRR